MQPRAATPSSHHTRLFILKSQKNHFKTSGHEQNGPNFQKHLLESFFFIFQRILIEVSFWGVIDNDSVWFQLMIWRWTGKRTLLEPMISDFYDVMWHKTMFYEDGRMKVRWVSAEKYDLGTCRWALSLWPTLVQGKSRDRYKSGQPGLTTKDKDRMSPWPVSSSAPEQHDHHFTDNIFRCIFVKYNLFARF